MNWKKGPGRCARRINKVAVVALLVSAVVVTDAYAGTDATFTPIVTMITNWAQGSLGKVIALAMFLIGVGMSVMRQSIAPVGVALAAALALYYAPTVIGGVLTGTVPHDVVASAGADALAGR